MTNRWLSRRPNWMRVQLRIHPMWLLQVVATIGGLTLAGLLGGIDEFTLPGQLGGILTTGGADGARDLVYIVASTSFTAATTTFSVTMVVLQLAGSQYSPRLPGQFLRDRITQTVLGLFIFTFVYSLAVVRSIAADDEYVPHFAVTITFLLSLLTIVGFLVFIHHIANAIRVEEILKSIEGATLRAARRQHAAIDRGMHLSESYEIPAAARPIILPASGLIQSIDDARLTEYGRRQDLVICLVRKLGDHVAKGTPAGWVWSRTEEDISRSEREINDAVSSSMQLGNDRSLANESAFGLVQIVDIAMRAASPAVNDPTTACNALQSAENILVQLFPLSLGDRAIQDRHGCVRLIMPQPTFEEYLGMVVTPVRRIASNELQIVHSLCRLLASIGRLLIDDPERQLIVADQLELALRWARGCTDEGFDRNAVEELGRDAWCALAGKPSRLT